MGAPVPEEVEELRGAIKGRVLLPGQDQDAPAVDEALRVWAVSPANAAQPRRPSPAVIVQPRGTADVAAAVKWATARGLPLAVKCGGHGGGNPCWVDGGVMLDLSLMRSVYVDPESRTAVVDGGALACDVDAETAMHGLAAPLGVCSVVGVGGLALNGGLSLLSRAVGATADNILEATVALADGSVVHATADSDPELLWALKGAGTALGVVTKLKLQLHEVSNFYCGVLAWRDEPGHATYKAVLRFVRDVVIPNPCIGFNLARVVDPAIGPLLVSLDTVGAASWQETQSTHAPAIAGLLAAFPEHYESWAGGHLKAEQLTEACIDQLVRWTADEVPPSCHTTLAFVELLGGRLHDSQAPVGWQGDVQWVVQAGWTDPAVHEEGSAYAAAALKALAPFCQAQKPYINMVEYSPDQCMDYGQAALTVRDAANLERLRRVKQRVDPTNMFRHTPLAAVLAAEAGGSCNGSN
ncbi:hypothetical protein COHA_005070 [Chlorella ohadii]|uniref:FAD-binding PCMH-type domain-containing protein n=1 Tax=Chlorella ohadii TaxID=2649997 RepID=A0AAD5H536_9CHLO|nr:hypothetical protein COHA_005070 [Chlorella ohadii]